MVKCADKSDTSAVQVLLILLRKYLQLGLYSILNPLSQLSYSFVRKFIKILLLEENSGSGKESPQYCPQYGDRPKNGDPTVAPS